MAVTVKHSTPADGTFSATGAAAWDADHNFTGTIDVANGGTGAATLTSNALLKGNGTSAISASTVLDDGTNVTTTSNLGVGITYPSYKAQISGSTASTSAIAQSLYVQGGTNLLTYSEQFDNADWAKTRSSISANATTAPDGTLTADKLIEDTTASSTHFVGQSATLSGVYTASVYIKAGERGWAAIVLGNATQGTAYFNLSSGAIGTVTSGYTAAISALKNGWYRCSIAGSAVSSANAIVRIYTATGDNGNNYTGDGTSGIYLWGAQLETGNVASPYVATTASAINGTSSAYFGGPVTLASTNRSAPAWTTNGIGLVQSAATFTDTTSTGTVGNVRMNNFAAQTLAAANTITVTNLWGAYFTAPTAGANVTASNRYAIGADSAFISGQFATNSSADISNTTAGLATYFASGTTASGQTKTIGIGMFGASGSTTNITLGSATSGATQTTTINGRVTLAPIGASAAAWTTNGIGLVQSAATFTDTSSTGTVADVRMNVFGPQTLAATNTITATNLYGTYFQVPAAGTNVTASNRFALGADSIYAVGTLLAGGAVTMTTATSNIGIGTNQTTGVLTLGGSSQTANINIAPSTVSQTIQVGYGTTASGNTKTVNIGTGGASGSTTAIALGSATSGATSTITLNGKTTFAGTAQLQGYTVATLPAGTQGMTAFVTDALAPMWNATLVGGGAVVCKAFYNGTTWVAG